MGLESMSHADAQSALLPATKTWLLDGSELGADWGKRQLEEGEVVSLAHPTDADGAPILSACTLSIKIQREFMTYVIKRLITDILVRRVAALTCHELVARADSASYAMDLPGDRWSSWGSSAGCGCTRKR